LVVSPTNRKISPLEDSFTSGRSDSFINTKVKMSNSAKIFFCTLIAVVLCAVVWRYLNTAEFVEVMKNTSLSWLAVSGLLFLVYQWLRTLRFSLLADTGGSGWQLFNTLCLHSFLNSTLPAGLGEAALVYLLKKLHGLPYPSGAALLLAARFIDLGLFCLLFFLVGFEICNVDMVFVLDLFP